MFSVTFRWPNRKTTTTTTKIWWKREWNTIKPFRFILMFYAKFIQCYAIVLIELFIKFKYIWTIPLCLLKGKIHKSPGLELLLFLLCFRAQRWDYLSRLQLSNTSLYIHRSDAARNLFNWLMIDSEWLVVGKEKKPRCTNITAVLFQSFNHYTYDKTLIVGLVKGFRKIWLNFKH